MARLSPSGKTTTTQQQENEMSYNKKITKEWLADKNLYYASWLYLIEKISQWIGWLFLIGGLVLIIFTTINGVSDARRSQETAIMLSGLGSAFGLFAVWISYESIRILTYGFLWNFVSIELNTRDLSK